MKLVARSGIGTIAAGVAKAKADVILISGHVGRHRRLAAYLDQVCRHPLGDGPVRGASGADCLNRLRHRVRLRTDGGIKTGRDVVIAAMLGAEEFGIGTASLVAMGCIMVRQCHSNTCPVGVCTQDPALRQKFTGTAGEGRQPVQLHRGGGARGAGLARLSARLNDVIGRTDLLEQVSRGAADLDDLDLNPLLVAGRSGDAGALLHAGRAQRGAGHARRQDGRGLPCRCSRHGEKMQLQYNIRNTYRAIGTRLSRTSPSASA